MNVDMRYLGLAICLAGLARLPVKWSPNGLSATITLAMSLLGMLLYGYGIGARNAEAVPEAEV